MPTYSNFKRGILPLFVLIAIGVVIAAGGAYIVRNEFVKTGKSGKAALDEAKIAEQAKNPQKLPDASKNPDTELAKQSETFSLSKKNPEIKFTINPPAGWFKTSSDNPVTVVAYNSPNEDQEAAEPPLIAYYRPHLEVQVQENPVKTLEEAASIFHKNNKSSYENYTVTQENKTTVNNIPAYYVDLTAAGKGIRIHGVCYLMVKEGFVINVCGNSLASAWDKNRGVITASINTFNFSN